MEDYDIMRVSPPRAGKSIRVCFLRNGNPHFQGVCLDLSRCRFKDFESLLEGITQALSKYVNLRSSITHFWGVDGTPFTTMLSFKEGDVVICCCEYETVIRVCYHVNPEFLRLNNMRERWELNRIKNGFAMKPVQKQDLPVAIKRQMINIRLLLQTEKTAIFRGKCLTDGITPFIVKVVDKEIMRTNCEDTFRETQMMGKLKSHKNILGLVYTIERSSLIYILMESLDFDLEVVIDNCRRVCKTNAKAVISAIASGLIFMKRRRIIHRDIKPGNIFIRSNGEVNGEDGWPVLNSIKIADFGMSIPFRGNKLHTCCGTTPYIAPEMISQSGYDYRVDLWSFGISIYQMFFRRRPFDKSASDDQREIYNNIMYAELRYPIDWSKSTNKEGRELINALLERNPVRRLTARGVKQHPYMTSS
ncbi:uncharacterized protein [Drosophila bipectinata]|uniref:uncharacterized protein n=1 Tax=Drosophila bipectinata TaxID=42026 RepID=UPI0038B2B08F